jgi:hypothetical protein
MSVSRTEACCSAFANHSLRHPRLMGSKEVNTFLIFFSNLGGGGQCAVRKWAAVDGSLEAPGVEDTLPRSGGVSVSSGVGCLCALETAARIG